jgi:enoyl-CoA hydratase/carnithine racemase
MSLGMGRLVTEALVRAEADSTITLVVLNAVGKSYSGGADMAETSTLPAPGSRSALEERQRIFMDK